MNNDSVLLSDIDMTTTDEEVSDDDTVEYNNLGLNDDDLSFSLEEIEAEEIRLVTLIRETDRLVTLIRETELRLSSCARNCDRLVEPEIIVAVAAA